MVYLVLISSTHYTWYHMKILVIDDVKDVADIMATNCQRFGLSVSTANTYAEAERLIMENNYDAVLADLALDDGQRGEDLLDIYKKKNPFGVSIAFTGEEEYELKTTPDRFLRKPVLMEDVESALTGVIRKSDARILGLIKKYVDPVVLIVKANANRIQKLEDKDLLFGKKLDMITSMMESFIKTNGKYGPLLLSGIIASFLIKLALDFFFK